MSEDIDEQNTNYLASGAFKDLENKNIKKALEKIILIRDITKSRLFGKNQYEDKNINKLANKIIKLLKKDKIIEAEELLIEIGNKLRIALKFERISRDIERSLNYKKLMSSRKYNTVQDLLQMGYLVCHVTNAFAGAFALRAGETPRRDPFKNITYCIENQGTNKFQLSCSTINPKIHPKYGSSMVMTKRMGINGSIGIILDSGYIYEVYKEGDTETKRKGKYEMSYLTGLKDKRSFPIEAINSGYSFYSFNELLVRAFTVRGLFYTTGVQEEVIKRLKEISDGYSHKKYISPKWINREEKQGVSKEAIKIYPIYEINPTNNKWKIVYTP